MRVLLAVAAAVVLAPLAGAADATQKLYVTFQLTGTFRVTQPDGTAIGSSVAPGTTITPGTYELVFDNSQNVKNLDFQVAGPNVSLQETMGGGEETSFSDYVTFLPNAQYRYFDGNNITSPIFFLQTSAGGGSVGANGSGLPGSNTQITGTGTSNATDVGSTSGSSGLGAGGAAPLPLRGALSGTVSGAGSVRLTLGGKTVTSLRSGRYTITVADHSARSGFTIQGTKQGATTVTAVPFVGTRRATLTLRPGQWLYYPTFVGKKTYFLVTR